MARRPCLTHGCPNPAERRGRCSECARQWEAGQNATVPTKAARNWTVRQHRAQTVADHRAKFGDWCNGYNREPHAATDLTADDPTPIAAGGDPMQSLVVLCRSCNSRKRSTTRNDLDREP